MLRKFFTISVSLFLLIGFIPNNYASAKEFKSRKKSKSFFPMLNEFKKSKKKNKREKKLTLQSNVDKRIQKVRNNSANNSKVKSKEKIQLPDLLDFDENFQQNIFYHHILYSNLMQRYLDSLDNILGVTKDLYVEYFDDIIPLVLNNEQEVLDDLQNGFLSYKAICNKDFKKAEEYTLKLNVETSRNAFFIMIAAGYFNDKNYSEAKRVMPIENKDEFEEYHKLLLAIYCCQKDYDMAKEVALSFEDKYDQDEALVEITKLTAKENSKKAYEFVQLINNIYDKEDATIYVIEAFSQTDMREAKKLLMGLTINDKKQLAIAVININNKNYDEVEKTALSIESWLEDFIFYKLITKYCKENEFQRAEEFAINWYNDEGLLYLVYVQLKLGNINEAKRILKESMMDARGKYIAVMLIAASK